MKKRVLAALCAFVLCLGLFAAPAGAEQDSFQTYSIVFVDSEGVTVTQNVELYATTRTDGLFIDSTCTTPATEADLPILTYTQGDDFRFVEFTETEAKGRWLARAGAADFTFRTQDLLAFPCRYLPFLYAEDGAIIITPRAARQWKITYIPGENVQSITVEGISYTSPAEIWVEDGKPIPLPAVTASYDARWDVFPSGNATAPATYTVTASDVRADCPCAPFTDVDRAGWYHEALDYVVSRGLMTGISSTEFAPNTTVSRAMMVTLLWRMEGEPAMGGGKSGTFADVPEDQWYTEAVEWCAAKGITEGTGNGNFAPHALITREQMAAMLYRYQQFKGNSYTGSIELNFRDADKVSPWATEALAWCCSKNIMQGKGSGLLDPGGSALRCEIAAILMRYCEL